MSALTSQQKHSTTALFQNKSQPLLKRMFKMIERQPSKQIVKLPTRTLTKPIRFQKSDLKSQQRRMWSVSQFSSWQEHLRWFSPKFWITSRCLTLPVKSKFQFRNLLSSWFPGSRAKMKKWLFANLLLSTLNLVNKVKHKRMLKSLNLCLHQLSNK